MSYHYRVKEHAVTSAAHLIRSAFEKIAVVPVSGGQIPPPAGNVAPPLPPGASPNMPPSGDPGMMGAPPMDPAMMGAPPPPGGAPPPAGAPMDPMAGGAPPPGDPSMAGGAPPGPPGPMPPIDPAMMANMMGVPPPPPGGDALVPLSAVADFVTKIIEATKGRRTADPASAKAKEEEEVPPEAQGGLPPPIANLGAAPAEAPMPLPGLPPAKAASDVRSLDHILHGIKLHKYRSL